MIGFLTGVVHAKGPEGCFLEVQGVGYKLACSATTLAALPADGERVMLWTHTHVREDALALYGFATEAEQGLFEALIGVSGVGPKVALALCSAFSPDAFRAAVSTEDIAALSSVVGLGKKTAQRIVLDLKDKMSLPDLHVVGRAGDARAQARSALENLGYSAGEVRLALSEIAVSEDEPVEEVVKGALKHLAGAR